MKSPLYCLGLLGWGLVLLAGDASAQEGKEPAAGRRNAGPAAASSDEREIRASCDAFEKAFNAGDARALAALWSANADYVDENGRTYSGRDAIEKEYATLFEAHPGLQMKIDVTSIRVLGPGAAMEDGRSTLIADGSPVSHVRYSAVHVKVDGKWLLSAVRDMASAEPAEGELAELDRFVGDWTARRDETLVKISCDWTAGKRFLLRTYEVSAGGDEKENGSAVAKSGMQIIGWDPTRRQIHSWTFDSTGGHGQGAWSRIEGGWVIESEGVLADGVPTASLELIELVDANIIGWQSVERSAGGQPLPDTEQVVLERAPAGR